MKLSPTAAETRKKKILETGIHLLRKTGPNGIGIQEIADASGIPKGSFYNYFPSKDHFLLEALEIYTNAAIQWNKSVLEEGGRGLSSLHFLYKKKVDLEKNFLQEELSCLINVLSQHSSSQRPELRKRLKLSLETISRGIIESLQVPESQPLLKRIQYLESSWRGAMLLSRATGDESYLENFLSNLKKNEF